MVTQNISQNMGSYLFGYRPCGAVSFSRKSGIQEIQKDRFDGLRVLRMTIELPLLMEKFTQTVMLSRALWKVVVANAHGTPFLYKSS